MSVKSKSKLKCVVSFLKVIVIVIVIIIIIVVVIVVIIIRDICYINIS